MVARSTNHAWLERLKEPALEPDLPICDPHHHLWDFREGGVQARYMLDEMLEDLDSGHNVVSTVFIECGTMFKADGPADMRCVGETEFANGIAAMSASGRYGRTRVAAGIIATADLKTGDAAAAVLDAQIAHGGGRVKGIRQGGFWHADPAVGNHRTNPPPGMFKRADFQAGFKHLAPRGLTFEALSYHTQLDDAAALARAFPDTTIILNHYGAPVGVGPYAGKRDEVFQAWKAGIDDIATCPNVVVKLGGLFMHVNGFGFETKAEPPSSAALADATRPYFEHTVARFGPSRAMFESNFPVDKLSCSYGVLWNAFKLLAKDFSAGEKAAMFHDTAARVYRL